ncbi:putative vegetative incompatibility protein HET-E-1 [Triangularia setosa]|uniref:Vegetative incompatibility protein HET-E-1 n=1 Tax=Triangularia setosa TaxID=2587417 RepID=A0AAN6VZX8_9PEZI|nr:putative vegetative incompatibility protein HET-E-1 [Podospora setosa]
MRLLNTTTIRLESPWSAPIYAILSHTWGGDEVLFADICDPQKPLPFSKKGFRKVSDSCERARQDGYKYIWIDTCCIDKTSSAELSEAINSMFRWYHRADRCYAYLSDVNVPGEPTVDFENSRWFTRGWTLQELIAPRDVRFYDSQWVLLGSRQLLRGTPLADNPELKDLADIISKTTGIPVEILRWFSPKSDSPLVRRRSRKAGLDKYEPIHALANYLKACGIGQIMSWAAYRFTTRKEDEAYSLLGLFSVNMPMLYGEGRRAFHRLQQEILKTSNDQSILAFERQFYSDSSSLLADSPRCFASSEIEQSLKDGPLLSGSMPFFELSPSPKAVDAGVLLCPLIRQGKEDNTRYLAILNCIYRSDFTSHPAIVLRKIDDKSRTFYRTPRSGLHRITPIDHEGWIEWSTVVDGVSNRIRYDLNKVYFETIRVYLEPPQRIFNLPSTVGPLASLYTPGMRIKLDIPELTGFSFAAYPHMLQVAKDRVYAPSITLPSWPKRFMGDQTPETNHLALFGTIILQFEGLGAVALSWGKSCVPERGDLSPEPFCAIMDWFKVVRASQDKDLPAFDLDSSALQSAVEFLYATNSWSWVSLLATKPDVRAEHNTSRMKVQCKIRTVEFFGRPLFELELSILPQGRSSFIDMVRFSFS